MKHFARKLCNAPSEVDDLRSSWEKLLLESSWKEVDLKLIKKDLNTDVKRVQAYLDLAKVAA